MIWIDQLGKQSSLEQNGAPRPAIRRLIAGGTAVIGVDLFGQGEFTADARPPQKTRIAPHSSRYAGYTKGFNQPPFAQRAH